MKRERTVLLLPRFFGPPRSITRYLKLGGWKLGLLFNFHAPLLREGIKRVVLGLDEPKSTSTQA